MIIAVDFDGTICENKWPNIGRPNRFVIDALKRHKENGDQVILWTCRSGALLEAAVQFCRLAGLEFDAINDNVPERIATFGNNSRKVSADEYWDDKAIPTSAVVINNMADATEKLKIALGLLQCYLWEKP